MEKAGVGARFVSYIFDSIIISVIDFAFIVVLVFVSGLAFWHAIVKFEGVLNLSNLLINMCYFTYFFGNGQTPGMKAMDIKLCGTDGTYPIGYGRGFLRWIGMIISGLVFSLGFLWILIDTNKQGWHDKIAGTYVVLD